MNDIPSVVVETTLFSRQATTVWSDLEKDSFIDYIADNPEAGIIIPNTGGVRKVRWSRKGSGKRGGVRVIYYYQNESIPIHLFMVYAKSRKENLNGTEEKYLRSLASAIKETYRDYDE